MSKVAEEIAYEDFLKHYGMPRRSGRYPWGSGDDPYQHEDSFLKRVDELKKNGWTETPENIMNEFGLTTTQYRSEKANANFERKCYQVNTAKALQKDGLGYTEIARKMSTADKTINESTVRSWLKEESLAKASQAKDTADFLREQIKEKGMIDVGTGVERELKISKEKLNQALKILEEEGYPVYKGGIPQATNPGKQTNQRVICPPGTEHKEIYNYENIHTITDYTSHDGGKTFTTFQYPASLDSKRLMIRYKDDKGPDGATGIDKDGVIELRRGVKDLSLGNSRYSQVRILVDGTHYLKGMAVYSDDMPDGVDVIFNTNKKRGTPALGDDKNNTVLKKIKNDPGNPFGSAIKPNGQSTYIDKDGKEKLSLINKPREEGDWSEWSNGLPSQFLGKQSLGMAKQQLNLAKSDKLAEYDDICSLTNPTIKKHLLNKFADECDSAAVHLKAAALPGQKYHVIVPVNTLKDNEVYAPNYENGTKLALIRYPHGGTFEIPICTVNNKHAPAKKLLGNAVDAIGINARVAERLSGADFDGDTVMCIPTHDKAGKVKITSTPPLKGLEGFDPKTAYPAREGMKVMKNTQTEMGKISNLITDMTLAGAKQEELAAAVRHSMVVIDAEKHHLNYTQSYIDNGIKKLSNKYQIHYNDKGELVRGGASTILSRAKGQQSVIKRQGSPIVNIKGDEGYDPSRPEGSLLYKTADDANYQVKKVNKRTGEVTTVNKTRTQKSTKMAETDDAYKLVSKERHGMELIYADYANDMKNLARKARIEAATSGKVAYSPNAKKTYQAEVKSLNDKLNTALLNAPIEREAQRRANAVVVKIKSENPDLKPGDIKKASQRELAKARTELGSVSRKDRQIEITDREWSAIQAGAISENKLIQILNNTDIDSLRQRATPKSNNKTLSDAKIARIKALNASNYSLNEIAKALGVSTSTVTKYLKGAA